jgi:hypothetical protein
MRALRKTHLQKNMAQVFWPHLEESDSLDRRLWKLPQFPQPLMLDIVLEKEVTTPSEGLSKIEWTRCSQKRKNLSSRPLSIGRF